MAANNLAPRPSIVEPPQLERVEDLHTWLPAFEMTCQLNGWVGDAQKARHVARSFLRSPVMLASYMGFPAEVRADWPALLAALRALLPAGHDSEMVAHLHGRRQGIVRQPDGSLAYERVREYVLAKKRMYEAVNNPAVNLPKLVLEGLGPHLYALAAGREWPVGFTADDVVAYLEPHEERMATSQPPTEDTVKHLAKRARLAVTGLLTAASDAGPATRGGAAVPLLPTQLTTPLPQAPAAGGRLLTAASAASGALADEGLSGPLVELVTAALKTKTQPEIDVAALVQASTDQAVRAVTAVIQQTHLPTQTAA